MRDQDFRSRRRDFEPDNDHPLVRAFGTRPRFNETRSESPAGSPVQAVVKWYNPEKGFGFVELSDGSGDAFLHGSVLAQRGIDAVQPGDTLEVRAGPGHKGPHITEVLNVEISAVPAAPGRSSFPSTRSSGPPSGEPVEETGSVKWFDIERLRLHGSGWRREGRVRPQIDS